VFLRSPEGRVKQTLGTGEDITDWKHAESQLRTSLTDKDALLREVHHRVKNNLQIISSLLDLQSNRVSDPELRKILLDSQNRISSMALVHENLYSSDTFARVNFTQYIYQLSTNLFNSLRRPDDETEMHLAIAPNVSVSLVQAVPCGLLLNELITNAIKHGLPATGTGRLSIECHCSTSGQIGLNVSTNSNNLDADFVPEQVTSLGMRLIVTLVKQLKGSLEVTRANPTSFFVQFPSTP
jgi:two-component sensor histidine kinase